jgi:hypothetical protein
LGYSETRAFLLYPVELVWGQVWSVGEVKALNQVLGHEVLLASIVQDESSQIMFDLTIMCKLRYIRDARFIIGHQDQRGVIFGIIFERDYFRMVRGIWLSDLCK